MIYTAPGISKQKTALFLRKTTIAGISEIHTMKIYRGEELLVDIALPPYTSNTAVHVYSLSKTLTSTAIGLLYDEGKINLHEKVTDIFEYTGAIGEYLARLEVHHLLSMSSGHPTCSMPEIVRCEDGIKAFFEKEFSYLPGTDFTYDTGASYMLSAIVSKITGQLMISYLNEKLFRPLEIFDCSWKTVCNINEGGVGLMISTESLAKIALMYLNKGLYNGKRILSEEWIGMATAKQVDNVWNGTVNWRVGYGYQIWMNGCGGYRGDGAFGQYLIVLPEKNIACVALTESNNMERQMDDIFEYLLDLDGEDEKDLDCFEQSYQPLAGEPITINKAYRLDENPMGYLYCFVSNEGSRLKLHLSEGADNQTIIAGNGEWIENEIQATNLIPVLQELQVPNRRERAKFYLSYHAVSADKVCLDIRYSNTPHHMKAEAYFGKKLQIKLTMYREELIFPGAERLSGITF